MSPERPPHVDRQWWYRATWKARQAAVDAHRRKLRRDDEVAVRVAELRANVERERAIHEARYRPQPKPNEPAPQPIRQGHMRRSERVALVDSMLVPGSTPAGILAEMGCKAATLIRACEREGRLDLAALFRPLEHDRHKGACKFCGAEVYRKYERCRACAQMQKARAA